jgi:hypothetical protein
MHRHRTPQTAALQTELGQPAMELAKWTLILFEHVVDNEFGCEVRIVIVLDTLWHKETQLICQNRPEDERTRAA